MEFKALQYKNAPIPIEVTEAGIITVVKAVQLSKALLPIDMTEDGMLIEIKLPQP